MAAAPCRCRNRGPDRTQAGTRPSLSSPRPNRSRCSCVRPAASLFSERRLRDAMPCSRRRAASKAASLPAHSANDIIKTWLLAGQYGRTTGPASRYPGAAHRRSGRADHRQHGARQPRRRGRCRSAADAPMPSPMRLASVPVDARQVVKPAVAAHHARATQQCHRRRDQAGRPSARETRRSLQRSVDART